MVMASEVSHALEIAEGYGWSGTTTPASTSPAFLEAKDVETRCPASRAANLGKAGVELVHGRAVLKTPARSRWPARIAAENPDRHGRPPLEADELPRVRAIDRERCTRNCPSAS